MPTRLPAFVWIPLLASTLAALAGCPKRGAGPGAQTVPEETFAPASEMLLDIARHEVARDAGSEIVPHLRHPTAYASIQRFTA